MIVNRLKRAAQSVRPPTPRRVIAAESIPVAEAQATISIGRSLESAIDGLDLPNDGRTLLVPDRRPASTPGSRAIHSVATSLGLPTDATTLRLGTSDWCRIEFGDRSLVLETADLPNDLYGDQQVVALSSAGDDGCLALWADYAHPNTALRARVATNAVVELSIAIDARYIIVSRVDDSWVAALASPGIVAELIARALQQHRARQRGEETPTPWEDVDVQHLFELMPPEAGITDLVLDVSLEDNLDDELARTLSDLLGWRLAVHFREGR